MCGAGESAKWRGGERLDASATARPLPRVTDETRDPDVPPRPADDARARREAALAKALRANLKRRKGPSAPVAPGDPNKDGDEGGEPLPPPRGPG